MSALAVCLKESLQLVDSIVFPQNRLLVFIFDCQPNPGQPQFALSLNRENFANSSYWIFSQGIEEYFNVSKARRLEAMRIAKLFHFSAVLKQSNFCWQEVAPYDEQKELLFAAIHEVRHRVQIQLRVELFREEHTRQIERCRWWGEIQSRHYRNNPHGNLEFDAKFIECYASFELKQARYQIAPEQLRQIVLLTPHEFLEKEKQKK